MTKKTLIALGIFLSLGLILFYLFANKSPQDSSAVEFSQNAYNPPRTIIKKHQKVTFINKSDHDIWPASNIHPTHGIYPEFDPQKPIPPGESWNFTFNKIGQWRYHDHLDPQITGIVIVE